MSADQFIRGEANAVVAAKILIVRDRAGPLVFVEDQVEAAGRLANFDAERRPRSKTRFVITGATNNPWWTVQTQFNGDLAIVKVTEIHRGDGCLAFQV